MSSTETGSAGATAIPEAGTVEMKLEVVVLPVAEVDRAKQFYASLGWRLDADFAVSDDLRVGRPAHADRLVQRPGRQRLAAAGRQDAAPGPVTGMDTAAPAELLRETEEHHGPYEATAAPHHWSGWYAAHIVARQQGRTPQEAEAEAGRHMEHELSANGAS